MVDIRQTPKYARYMQSLGWKVEKIGNVYPEGASFAYVKKIPILGAVLKIQRPEKLNITQIEALSKKYRIFQIIIEPSSEIQAIDLLNRGYKLSKSPYLPTKTLELDLSQSKKELFKNLKKDAKYALRKTSRLKLSTNPNLKSFHEFWVKSVPWQRWVPPARNFRKLQQTFGSSSGLLLASHNVVEDNKPYQFQFTAGAIFLNAGKRAYYWQAFTSPPGRVSLAQYRLLWEGILWAKSCGAQYFDFEGIYDSRFPNEGWLGFSRFKKKFGGMEVEYPGAYTKTWLGLHFGGTTH